MLRIVIALIIAHLSCAEIIFAQHRIAEQRNLIFDRIGSEQGLSQGLVTAITQDLDGFIWVGTQEGLNRFDGFRFESYYHIDDEPASLSHDYIRSILFDVDGQMWIGTDGGLDRFDSATNSFEAIDLHQVGNEKIVYTLLADDLNNLWIGTSEGLVIRAQNGTLTWFREAETSSGSIDIGPIRTIFRTSTGTVLLGTEENGVLEGTIVKGFSEYHSELSSQNVRDIVEDSQQRVWVATFDDGAYRLSRSEPDGESLMLKAVEGINSNRIRSMLKDHDGNIWLGTDRGLKLWEEKQRIVSFEHDLSNPRSISDNTILELYQDQGGVIWVGTFNGISKWNARIEMFPYFRRPVSESSDAQSNNITSFVDDGEGNVWVGTFAGLMKWDNLEGELKSIDPEVMRLGDQRVMSLGIHGDQVWAGTVSSGVNVIVNDKVIHELSHDPEDQSSVSSNAITRIYTDSKGRAWVATYGAGVNLYLGEGKFQRFPSEERQSTFPDLRCMDILEAPDGKFWISTQGGGVVILDPTTGNTELLQHDPNNLDSLPSNEILTLLRTNKGMWMGSVNKGLSFFDLETKEISRFSKKDGLASDSVYGLLSDNDEMIWASGGKGLSMLNPKTGQFAQFDSSHGLQSSDFNSGAYSKLADGSLIFGGNNGFNAFFPQNIRRNAYVPPVHITGFRLFNRRVSFEKSIADLSMIELGHDDTVLGFEFAALDYTAPKKNQYRYMLEGFDRDWVEHQGNREVTYTNLDAGRYVFKVQGSNNDGVWNRDGASVSIVVKPAPWLTWWAYSLYGLLFIGFLYLLLRYNSGRLKREAERRYSERLQLYIESLEEASDCILIADSTGALMYANRTIMQGLNKTPEEVQGKPLWDVLFEQESDIEAAKHALSREGRFHGEVEFRGLDESAVTHEVTIASVHQSSRSGSAYVGISRDVTQRKITEAQLEDYRKNLELLVEERTEALQKEIAENKAIQVHLAESLQEKELLIKEVHHRVKNNMQVISSLLSIQAEGTGDDVYATLLNESQQRIKSMALIHETLYQSKDLLKIDFQEYIETLTTSLSRSYSTPGVAVQVSVNVEDVELDLETAVPCGLIINELVSNSLKHAFKHHKGPGLIDINFVTNGCNYCLSISDNGSGLPEGFDVNQNVSMGMEIVSILTTQLEGKLSANSEGGASFDIQFPKVVHD